MSTSTWSIVCPTCGDSREADEPLCGSCWSTSVRKMFAEYAADCPGCGRSLDSGPGDIRLSRSGARSLAAVAWREALHDGPGLVFTVAGHEAFRGTMRFCGACGYALFQPCPNCLEPLFSAPERVECAHYFCPLAACPDCGRYRITVPGFSESGASCANPACRLMEGR